MNIFSSTLMPQKGMDLCKWALSAMKRFPSWLDFSLIKGIHTIFGMGVSMDFVQQRSISHLKRLLIMQFFLQKKLQIEPRNYANPLLVKIFRQDELLCINIAYVKKNHTLTHNTILDTANKKFAALKKIPHSFYQWQHPELPYVFCYAEIQKIRGKELTFLELKMLEKHLAKKLKDHLLETQIFWPYNHEEAFKRLLVRAI